MSFADFVIENEIIGFFDQAITLKSGRSSHFYVNWRRATNDAYLLDRLTDYLVQAIEDHKLDCNTLYGVPEGASKTAVITAFKLAKKAKSFAPGSHGIAMGRAKPKAHGVPEDRYFIGAPQGATYVLEDTITTGLSLFQCLDQLFEAGVDVKGVICLTDRCERRDDGRTVAETLESRFQGRVSYLALSRAPELLQEKVRRQRPSPALVQSLAQELNLSPQQLGGGL